MKKKVNIVLIVIVSVLWGTVGYRYVNQYFIKDKITDTSTNNHYAVRELALWEKDTFTLLPLKRDPFLNKSSLGPKATVQAKRKVFSNIRKERTEVASTPFPQVIYYGYLKGKDKKAELILLKIDNKLVKLRIGESSNGLKAIRVTEDSLQITFNGIKKNLKKN